MYFVACVIYLFDSCMDFTYFSDEFGDKHIDDKIELYVYDHDEIGSDDFMGYLSFDLSTIREQKIDGWFPLEDKPGKSKKKKKRSRGEMNLRILYLDFIPFVDV